MIENNKNEDRSTIAIVAAIAFIGLLGIAVIALALSASRSDATADTVDSNLIGKVWQWFEFTDPSGSRIVNDPSAYTVEFTSDGTVRVQADCNSGNGTYTADGTNISIQIAALTRAMCPPDSLSDQFINNLNAATIYFFEGDTLLMDLPMDSGTMKLAESPPDQGPQVDPKLVSTVWKWFEFQSPVGEKLVADPPSLYSVAFMSDGTVHVQADCNSGNGVYTADGSNIDIQVQAMTLAMCPPGSLSDQFVQGLNTAAIYSFEGDVLLMDLPMDSGTMKFAESPPEQEPQVDSNLIGKVWKWFEYQSPVSEKLVVNDPNQYTVAFMSDGTVHVQADCNRGNGIYTADGSSIDIQVQAMTLAACPPGSLSDQFVRGLNAATIYFFEGDVLLMDLPMDSGTMKLAESPPAAPLPPTPAPTTTPAPVVDPKLIGKVWKWFDFQFPSGEKVVVDDPAKYTVEFMSDRTVRVQADCNTGTGSHTADGSSINIQVQAMTLAACPPGSLSDQFVRGLDAAAIYFFEGDVLLMDLPMDSGTMKLAVNPPTPPPPQVDTRLIGKVWKWFEFQSPVDERLVVDNPSKYTVAFMSDGTVRVQADCNTGSGSHTADGSSINIQVQAMTLAACSPGSLGDQFVRALNAAAIYFFERDVLLMDLPMDSGTMKFAVTPPASAPGVDPNLLGKVWQWTQLQDPSGEALIVEDASRYTVEFTSDGMVRVRADCNTGNGAYTADGTNISIQIGALTRAACPPGSLSDQFVDRLNSAATYFFEAEGLFIDTATDGRTMIFARRP